MTQIAADLEQLNGYRQEVTILQQTLADCKHKFYFQEQNYLQCDSIKGHFKKFAEDKIIENVALIDENGTLKTQRNVAGGISIGLLILLMILI